MHGRVGNCGRFFKFGLCLRAAVRAPARNAP
jgi:hypothetical protein